MAPTQSLWAHHVKQSAALKGRRAKEKQAEVRAELSKQQAEWPLPCITTNSASPKQTLRDDWSLFLRELESYVPPPTVVLITIGAILRRRIAPLVRLRLRPAQTLQRWSSSLILG